jgi:hypothetical protein
LGADAIKCSFAKKSIISFCSLSLSVISLTVRLMLEANDSFNFAEGFSIEGLRFSGSGCSIGSARRFRLKRILGSFGFSNG